MVASDARAAGARRLAVDTTFWSSPTRSTSTWCSTIASTSRWPTIPGMAERTDHHLERGEDVQRHRLEDRLGLRPSRTHRGRARRQAVPDLRRRGTVPARGGPRTQHRGRVGGRAAGLVAGQARQAGFRTGRHSASRCTTASAPTSCAPTLVRWAIDDSTAFCARASREGRRGRDPDVGVLRPRGAALRRPWNHLVRFAFCKRDDTLDEAIRRLS